MSCHRPGGDGLADRQIGAGASRPQPDAAHWASRIERALVRVTTVTRLEADYAVRSGPELRSRLRQPPLASMPVEYLAPVIEDRAVGVMTLLADHGQHRALAA